MRVHEGEAFMMGLVVLQEEEDTFLSLSLCKWERWEKAAVYKARKSAISRNRIFRYRQRLGGKAYLQNKTLDK